MMIKSILLLAVLLLHSVTSHTVTDNHSNYKLIAHRGGVVEDKFAENSRASLREAINRKYWMIEVDIRETKDGVAITQHDANFQRFFNDSRKATDMTWEEIKALRSSPGNEAPLSFDEFVKMCQGKVKLMLDTKEPHSQNFCQEIESILRKYDMLSDSYVIGSTASRKYFLGKAKVGSNFTTLQQLAITNKDLHQQYFLFEHGNVLNDEMLRWTRSNKVTVVPSVNKFHYGQVANMMEAAHSDIVRLQEAGVQEFQIDSEFDRWF